MGVALLVVFAAAAHAADTAPKYQAPRNEYGQPDLRGVWNFSSDVPLQRPKDAPDKLFQTREDIEKSNAAREKQFEQFTQQGVGAHNEFWLDYKSQAENLRTSLLIYPPNGRMPKLRRRRERRSAASPRHSRTFPGRGRCASASAASARTVRKIAACPSAACWATIGPPFVPSFYNNYRADLPGRDHVVILNEMIHDARTVPLDGRPPLDRELRGWYGDSRGRWEGDTLVDRDAQLQRPDAELRRRRHVVRQGRDRALHARADDRVDYEVTIVDPKTFTDRFTLRVPDGARPTATLRVRLPRRQLRHGNHPRRRAPGRARRAQAKK